MSWSGSEPGPVESPTQAAEARPAGSGSKAAGSALLAASTLMALGTLISRVLGLVRNSLQIAALGSGAKGDIFQMATTLPNQAYILIAGGTLNAILVPLIVRAIRHDEDGGEAYINRILTLFLLIMFGATALCMAATPLLLRINNPIWFDREHTAYLQNLTALTYLTLPQIFFFGVFFITGQLLNARERFGPMMWAPIANNVVAIVTFVLYLVVNGSRGDAHSPYTASQISLLGVGSTLGIVAQAGFMIYYLRSEQFRFRPRFDFRGTGLGRTFHLAKWVIVMVVVSQIATTLTNMIANGATAQSERGAGQAILNYANLIWMMPHGLITVSITTALTPSIAAAFSDGRLHDVRAGTERALRLTSVAVIPISVALIIYAVPVAQLIFGYGRGHDAIPALSTTLIAYAVGLPWFTASFVLYRTQFAVEDSRGALLASGLFDGIWVVASFLLVVPFHAPQWTAPAVALAYSIANFPATLLAYRLLAPRVPGLKIQTLLQLWGRLLLAIAPGALVAWFVMNQLLGPHAGRLAMLLGLLVTGAVAVGLFYVMARVLHVDEVADTVAMVLRRRRGGAAVSDESPDALVGQDFLASEHEGDEPLDVAAVDDELEATATPPSGGDAGPTAVDDPGAISDTEPDAPVAGVPTARLDAGQVLADRYRLVRFVAQRGSTVTWQALDEALSRTVLIHVMRPGDPRAAEILAAARRASAATDSRYLRVLDAVHSTDPSVGGYVVCEYVPGENLEQVLAHGPLSALEAGWIVRELADALTGMHGIGLFHGRLNPDTVVITDSGNVKIVGFGTEAALHPHPDDDSLSDLDWAAADVESLGKLLYACLIARWPGATRYGLDGVPRVNGHVASPRQVRDGVSPALDQICDQILSRPPRGGLPALRSAADIMVALSRVLGSADASDDLSRRLSEPSTPGYAPPRSVAADSELTSTQIQRPVGIDGHPVGRAAAQPVDEFHADARDQIGTPDTRHTPLRRPRNRARRNVMFLTALVVGALIIGLLLVFGRPGPQHPETKPSAAATQQLVDLPITGAKDFDPDGSGGENPAEVGAVFDGNPDTVWHTEVYSSAALGNALNKKQGVGIYVDLGSVQTVRRVVVTVAGGATDFQVRVPDGDAGVAPQTSKAWQPVGDAKGATGETGVVVPAVKTRYVLIWITGLPEVAAGRYQASIAEIQVQS